MFAGVRSRLRRLFGGDRAEKLDKPEGVKQGAALCPEPKPAWDTPGGVRSFQPTERGLVAQAERGALRLSLIASNCIQVRFAQSGQFADPALFPFSYPIAKTDWPLISPRIEETAEAIALIGPEITCHLSRSDCRLTFSDAEGRVISREAAPVAWNAHEFRVSRELPDAELPLGLAAQPTTLNLRGRRYLLWNTDPVGTARDKIPSYYTIPFYLGASAAHAFGLFWDNPSRGYVDVGAEHTERLVFAGSVGEARYYVFAGADIFAVLQRYTELTGRMPLQPLWALGFHISRWSYAPDEKVREIARELRARRFPCDAIYLDIDYMDGYRVFSWNPEGFRNPAALINELAAQGIKVVAILDPGIKADPDYEVYQSGLREGVFVKYPDGREYVGPCWPGDAVYPDFTDPKARAWWVAQCETVLAPGVAGLWNDMNEPVIFNAGTMPDEVRHNFEGNPTNHVEAHNVYGMQMARATREALEKFRPDKRPFNMVRAGYAGVQRYASAWTGDNRSDWDHLKLAITMTLNSGLSGLAFNGPDVGGFFDDCEPELFIRFMQVGAVMPYFRVHTAAGTAPQEPWAFGQPYEDIARQMVELRYQLLPYLYSVFYQCSDYGWPILRPLFTLDPSDERLRNIEDAFMVGDSLLAAPVLEKGQTERKIYLPRGRWYDYYTGRGYTGGQEHRINAPLEALPLFIRAGHVIPTWPAQLYAGQGPIGELGLRIGAGAGEITIYEDAGEGLEYRQGMYRWLYFTTSPLPGGGLAIAWRRAGKYQPSYERVRCVIYGIMAEPERVEIDSSPAPLWYYERGVVEFTANRPFENARILMAEEGSAATLVRSPFKDRE